MTETLTVREVADQLGVSHTTIKKWVDSLFPGEPERDSHGRWRLAPEQVRVLETVKALRAEDKGINTISRIIGPASFTEVSGEIRPQPERVSPEFHPQGAELRELIRAEVSGAIQSNNDLAEKYARAAHRIGELEAETRALQARMDESVALLGDGREREQAASERAARAEAEATELRRLLEAERAKSWWQKLRGR